MELLVLVLAVLTHLIIGLFTFFHNPRSYTLRFFLLFTIVSAAWGIANYFSLHQITPEGTLNAIRWVMFSAVLHSLFLFLTIQTFPSPKITLNKFVLLGILFISFVVLIFTRTPLIFSTIEGAGSTARPIPGPGILLFGLTTGFFILGSIYLLISRYLKAKGIRKAQLQYLIFGVIGSALLIFVTNFLLVVIFKINSLLILGPTYTLIFIGFTSYAIVTKHLFDIRIIIRRTVVFSGLLIFALAIYSLVIFVATTLVGGGGAAFTARQFIPNIIAAILIAAGFEPLRKWLTETTDKFLFKGEYQPQEVLRALSETLSGVVDLDEAINSMMKIVVNQMRLKNAATFTLHKIDHKIEVKKVKQIGYKKSEVLELDSKSPLIQFFALPQAEISQKAIVTEELERTLDEIVRPEDKQDHAQIIQTLQKLKAAVALPIYVKKQLIGLFLVGEKLSGDAFVDQDLNTLEIVASNTAAAIEKARFYEEDILKSEFVSVASHELLTPTSAIEGYLSMILDEGMGKTDSKAKQFLTRVYQSSKRLSTLVKELLDVSRIEAGRVVLDRRPLNLKEIIDNILAEYMFKAKEAKVSLNFVPSKFKDGMVYADRDKTIQVLTNFLGNGIKYNHPGGGVDVKMLKVNGQMQVSISDTGMGIPQDEQRHLFEKFFRASNASDQAVPGTGLGLYITKQLVDLMNGRVGFRSEEGGGSTFWFSLPQASGKERRIVTGDPKLMSEEQRSLATNK